MERVAWPIKVCFVAHCVLVFLWTWPMAPPPVRDGRMQGTFGDRVLALNDRTVRDGPLRGYLKETGLWQYWDMFSPNPLSLDYWMDAEIRFADGSTRRQAYPRMKDLSLGERFLRERFRKFLERGTSPTYQMLWPAMGQWLAQRAFTDPENPPVGVRLVRHERVIPPPPGKMGAFTSYDFFDHVVDVDALRRPE